MSSILSIGTSYTTVHRPRWSTCRHLRAWAHLIQVYAKITYSKHQFQQKQSQPMIGKILIWIKEIRFQFRRIFRGSYWDKQTNNWLKIMALSDKFAQNWLQYLAMQPCVMIAPLNRQMEILIVIKMTIFIKNKIMMLPCLKKWTPAITTNLNTSMARVKKIKIMVLHQTMKWMVRLTTKPWLNN